MPVRIVVISDTHLRHRELRLPKGDLLIHCGDLFTLQSRDRSLVTDLDDWFGAQGFDQIVCIGGNHDHILQDIAHREPQPFANAHYLQDTTFRYAGLNIHGSPWVPDLPYHAYDRDGAELANTWARIPDNSDILITHVPPAGRLDRSSQGHSHGCPLLAAELPRIAPKVHFSATSMPVAAARRKTARSSSTLVRLTVGAPRSGNRFPFCWRPGARSETFRQLVQDMTS